MQRAESLTLGEMRRFLNGSEEITFAVEGRAEMYNWIGKVLEGREYERLSKAERGRRRFVRRYTVEDVRLLAELDEAHEALSGPATKCILERESGRRVRISGEIEGEWASWARRAHLNVGSKREGESREILRMLAISRQFTQARVGYCR